MSTSVFPTTGTKLTMVVCIMNAVTSSSRYTSSDMVDTQRWKVMPLLALSLTAL